MLSLCELSRSTFNSWKKSGLELLTENAAYGLAEVVSIVLLAAARKYLPPKEMLGAWRELAGTGADVAIVNAARNLEEGDRFDLIVEPEHATLRVALSEEELLGAVRHPSAPRPVVVLDLAERIQLVVATFNRIANTTPRPEERSPGRPRSAERNVRVLPSAGGP